jgi:hypothetical protein
MKELFKFLFGRFEGLASDEKGKPEENVLGWGKLSLPR